jgi:Peptidase family M48
VTYYWLAAALCLSVMFLVIAVTSPLAWSGSRLFRNALHSLEPRAAATLLFSIRILHVLLAGLGAFAFALPAFLEYEPRATNEGMSARLAGLALGGVLVLLVMAWRAARLLRVTASVQRRWRMRSEEIRVEGCDLPVHCVDGAGPLLSVTGMLRPKVFVGREIMQTLSAEELSAALNHEMAHVRSFDNLKQFLLRITQPPAWLGKFWRNDAGWVAVAEVAADEEALESGASALDMSTALVKIGRLAPATAAGEAVLASQFVPEGPPSAVEMRVARLEQWLEDAPHKRDKAHRRPRVLLPILVAALVYAACIGSLLPWIHEGLEMIVR